MNQVDFRFGGAAPPGLAAGSDDEEDDAIKVHEGYQQAYATIRTELHAGSSLLRVLVV